MRTYLTIAAFEAAERKNGAALVPIGLFLGATFPLSTAVFWNGGEIVTVLLA